MAQSEARKAGRVQAKKLPSKAEALAGTSLDDLRATLDCVRRGLTRISIATLRAARDMAARGGQKTKARMLEKELKRRRYD